MKILLTGLLFGTFFLGYAQISEKSITELSQKDADTGILIDVRTPEEFEAGHLDTAINIDWFAADFKERVAALAHDKNQKVYVYCKKGGRSAKAAQGIGHHLVFINKKNPNAILCKGLETNGV